MARQQAPALTFGQRLRDRRRIKGYGSATSFAAHIGLDKHAYRRYERDETQPNFAVLAEICEALGCTPNDLLSPKARAPRPKPAAHAAE